MPPELGMGKLFVVPALGAGVPRQQARVLRRQRRSSYPCTPVSQSPPALLSFAAQMTGIVVFAALPQEMAASTGSAVWTSITGSRKRG